MKDTLQFLALIRIAGINPYVEVPVSVVEQLGGNRQSAVKIKLASPPAGLVQNSAHDVARIPAADAARLRAINRLSDDGWFRTTLVPRKAGDVWLFLDRWMRSSVAATVGDRVHIWLRRDAATRELPLPDALVEALAGNLLALERWLALTPSRRHEILTYLNFLKTSRAVARNVEKVIRSLTQSTPDKQVETQMNAPDFTGLTTDLQDEGIYAIALLGSFARGDAGRYSDIDIVRFYIGDDAPSGAGTHLVGEQYVVVSDVSLSQIETWFAEPEAATSSIAGVRGGIPLWDPARRFESIRRRAAAFVWDAAMQQKADAYASGALVGWIEEAQKGLEGLLRGDTGRLLNARFGLSWGLTNVMRVQRGILIAGDNDSYPAVVANLGEDSEWSRLSRDAFGITGLPLEDQVRAGLKLFVLTVRLLDDCLREADRPLLLEAVTRIREAGL